MQPSASEPTRRQSRRRVQNSAANPPDERTPFDPARFPGQRLAADPFSLPEQPPAPILERVETPSVSAAPPRRRGRPRKTAIGEATAKVGYDPNPTIIENPPECDESVASRGMTANDSANTEKRTLPDRGASPSPTGNPAMGTVGVRVGRRRQRPSVGTPAETPDRSGVRSLPERMFTPSRATEIEATPMPDYPLSHDGDEPIAGNSVGSNLQGVSSKIAQNRDLDGEDFDLSEQAMNLRSVPSKRGKKRSFSPQNVRLPSRSGENGTDSPVTRRTPPIPDAPMDAAPSATLSAVPSAAPSADREKDNAGLAGHTPSGRRPFTGKRFYPVADPPRVDVPIGYGLSDDGDGRESRRDRGDRDYGNRRYYDDGSLCGWLSDPAFGNAPMGNDREQFHCISIIGQIEGHSLLPEGQKATKYEHIIPTLVSVEEDDRVDGLLVILNTMGGDVEAGLAIAEMIASMTKPTVSLVLGGGHSIGVPLATAAKYSLIVPSATMTIHPVRVSGMVVGVPQSFRYMSEMQERITQFICSHSRAKPEDIRELMMRPDQIATDCGSILEGHEAVHYGIIDEVGGLDRALSVLREMCASGKKKNKT